MIEGTTFWFCTKCEKIIKKKIIGNVNPRYKFWCGCIQTTITRKELCNGQIKDEVFLKNGWVKAKILKS